MSTSQLEPNVALEAPALTPPRRERWIDLLFVLAIVLWRPIFASTMYVLHWVSTSSNDSNLRVFDQMLAEAAGVAVLVYVLRKRNASIDELTRRPEWQDIPRALMLYIGTCIAAAAAWYPINFVSYVAVGHYPAHAQVGQLLGMQATVIWLVFQFVNPWYEELIVRGFLMTELSALTGVRTAVIASTLVQVSYHLYQGWMNATAVGVIFLIFSIYYARTRRLLPIIIAHTLQDVLALMFYLHHR
ncbi:MAG TPA: CPBP family intramembrane glutamic endopeptidase [Acidobacteriaceae bacterium]